MSYQDSLEAFKRLKPAVAVQQGAAAFTMLGMFKEYFYDINEYYVTKVQPMPLQEYSVIVDNLMNKIEEIPTYTPPEE